MACKLIIIRILNRQAKIVLRRNMQSLNQVSEAAIQMCSGRV